MPKKQQQQNQQTTSHHNSSAQSKTSSKTDLQYGLWWGKLYFGCHVCPRTNLLCAPGTTIRSFIWNHSIFAKWLVLHLLLSPWEAAPRPLDSSWTNLSCSSLLVVYQTQMQGPVNRWFYFQIACNLKLLPRDQLFIKLFYVLAVEYVSWEDGPGTRQRKDGHISLCVGTLEEGWPPLQWVSWESRWQQQGPNCAKKQLLTTSLWTGGEFESWPCSTSQSWTRLMALKHCCHLGCPLWCDTTSQHCRTTCSGMAWINTVILANFLYFLIKTRAFMLCLRQPKSGGYLWAVSFTLLSTGQSIILSTGNNWCSQFWSPNDAGLSRAGCRRGDISSVPLMYL